MGRRRPRCWTRWWASSPRAAPARRTSAASPPPRRSPRRWWRGSAGDQDGDPPGIADQQAAVAFLVIDARRGEPVAHGRQRAPVAELDGPVAQADDALRDPRHPGAAPDVEGEVVVVAAGRDERRRAEVRHHVEAEDLVVEGQAAVDVADVEVHVADAQAGPGVLAGRLVGDRSQQGAEVQRRRSAGVHVLVGRPAVARAVGGELEPVAVGVGQVDRLVRAVVGRAVDRRVGRDQAHRLTGELLARGIQQRDVVEAGMATGAAGARALVQDDDLVVAGPERGHAVLAAQDAQPERRLVERQRALEVGDVDVDGAEAQRRGERRCAAGGGVARAHDLMAEMSRLSLTLSDTSMLPEPSTWLNFMSKSARLSWPVISRPTRSLPHGSISEPWISAWSATSRVMP